MKVNRKVYDHTAPDVPVEERMRAARGQALLDAPDLLTALAVLSRDRDAQVRGAARETLSGLPRERLIEALDTGLDPFVLREAASLRQADGTVLTKVALNTNIDPETLNMIVRKAPAPALDEIMRGMERLEDPSIIDALRENPNAREAVIEEALKKLGRGKEGSDAEASGTECAAEAAAGTEEPQEEEGEEKRLNITQQIALMTVSEKIKLANTGNKEVRDILVKEANKMISSAVLKNARITEEEVIRLTASKSTPDDLIRIIARNREWMKLYRVKSNLVRNAKTPLAISIKLVRLLNQKDLLDLSKSRNIPSVLSNEAGKVLAAKKKR